MGFRFYCVATIEDWFDAFGKIKEGMELLFYSEAFHEQPNIQPFTLTDLPSLDTTMQPTTGGQESYRVLLPSQKIVMETIYLQTIPRPINNVRYLIDSYNNPYTFVFRPGGLLDEEYFIVSEISSRYDQKGSVSVAKRFVSYARRHWEWENTVWIAPNCKAKFGRTHRFTEDARLERLRLK